MELLKVKKKGTIFALPSDIFSSFDNMFYSPIPYEQMVHEPISVVLPVKEKTADMEEEK